MPRKWTEEVIISNLRAIAARGEPMNPYYIEKNYVPLRGGCERTFGSISKAIVAAGFDVTAVYAKVPYWTRNAIIKAIKDRHALGLDMSPGVMNVECSGVYQAGCDRFGTWADALEASGINPDDAFQRKPFSSMSDESLLERLRRFHREGVPLRHRAFKEKSPALLKAVAKRFGRIKTAFERAGLLVPETAADIERKSILAREKVIARIRDVAGVNQTIEGNLRRVLPRDLVWASIRLFGRVTTAVNAAGVTRVALPLAPIDAAQRIPQKKYRWTGERVTECIAFRFARGMALNRRSVNDEYRGLSMAAVRFYRTWEKALIASGIDPYTVGVGMPSKYPDKEAVIAAIQKRHASGEQINPTVVCRDDQQLYSAAFCHFGLNGWYKAIKAAGYSPANIYVSMRYTKEDVLDELRERQRLGLPLNVVAMMSEPSSTRLYTRACRQFEHYSVAIRAIGLDYEKDVSLKKCWRNSEELLAAIRELEQKGMRLNHKNIFLNYRQIHSGARKFFGCWSAAVEAAGFRYADHCLVHSTKAWRRRLTVEQKMAIRNDRTVRVKPKEK